MIGNIFWISSAAQRRGEIQWEEEKFTYLCASGATSRKTVMMSNELPQRLYKEITTETE